MDAIGTALRQAMGERPPLTVWTSDAGRARQSWAVIADHLGLDWFDARVDPRLTEIGLGEWGGRLYAEVLADGAAIDPATGWLNTRAPGGEWFGDLAARLSDWVADARCDGGDRLVVMHGMSSRVLRGLLTGGEPIASAGAGLAPALAQGSVVAIEDGVERLVVAGDGGTLA